MPDVLKGFWVSTFHNIIIPGELCRYSSAKCFIPFPTPSLEPRDPCVAEHTSVWSVSWHISGISPEAAVVPWTRISSKSSCVTTTFEFRRRINRASWTASLTCALSSVAIEEGSLLSAFNWTFRYCKDHSKVQSVFPQRMRYRSLYHTT
jgi:hypothetical protein